MSSSEPVRILVVEDDPAHAELIRRAFDSHSEPPALTVVRTLAEAEGQIEGGEPDLLITDWRLPDGDGFELLRQPERRTFPAVVMTGHGDQRTAVRAMRAGAVDYVVKSAPAFEAMPQIVRRALREWSLIEERTRLEEELRASQRMEAIGHLAGGIAHDFNNLLTIIGTHLELIAMAAPENNDIQDSANEIFKAYESAAALTRQMLAFGGKQVMDPVVLDLNDSVRSVSGMLNRVIGEEYDLQLRLTEESCPVEVEPASFEQVVVNLLMNARDAMPGGGAIQLSTDRSTVHDALPCQGGLLPAGDYVRLTVQDRGHGMTPEVLQKAFDPFFTTKPRGSGTGLGLPSTLGIIRQSGGDVRVRSIPNLGTTFKVYLPAAQRDQAAPSIPSASEFGPLGGTETILVAEDDPGIRSLVDRMLASRGYRVLLAEDGEQAIDVLRKHGREINLLVTDVVMPKVSGPEVAEWLDENQPDLRTLFVSGYVDDRLPASRLDPNKARYLAKPFTSRSLCEAVRELLDTDVGPRAWS